MTTNRLMRMEQRSSEKSQAILQLARAYNAFDWVLLGVLALAALYLASDFLASDDLHRRLFDKPG